MIPMPVLILLVTLSAGYYVGEKAVEGIKKVDHVVAHAVVKVFHKVFHK